MSHTASRLWLWRWHFYAALFVFPFLLLLSVTGGIYLFKPQLDAWEEQRIHQHANTTISAQPVPLSASQLLAAAQTAYPSSQFKRYTLPKANDRTAEVELFTATAASGAARTLWLDVYTGEILADKATNQRFLQQVKKLHSELLLGDYASYLVELAASWCIILVVSGIYLRLSRRTLRQGTKAKTTRWRLRHGDWGLVLSIPLLLLLLTGLPWTQLWGDNFKTVKEYLGWNGPGQEWFVTLKSSAPAAAHSNAVIPQEPLWETSSHHHHEPRATHGTGFDNTAATIQLHQIANKPQVLALAHPVNIMPPKADNGVWSVRSMSANRAERETLHFDQHTGEPILTIAFADHHPVQRVISHGISLHEGALFGGLNQALMLATVMLTITVCCFGVYAWWLRRPKGYIAAPKVGEAKRPKGLMIGLAVAGVLLPAAGISMVVVLLVEFGWRLFGVLKRRVLEKSVVLEG